MKYNKPDWIDEKKPALTSILVESMQLENVKLQEKLEEYSRALQTLVDKTNLTLSYRGFTYSNWTEDYPNNVDEILLEFDGLIVYRKKQ